MATQTPESAPHARRPLRLRGSVAVIAAFVAGACSGTAAVTVATQSASAPPGLPPAGPDAGASVLALRDAEVRRAPSGMATVTVLAHGQGAWLGKLAMAPGAAVPEHADATEEFIHILAGRGQITIAGETREVRPGTTITMPAGARVSYQNGDEQMVALQVFAGPAPASKYQAWKRIAP